MQSFAGLAEQVIREVIMDRGIKTVVPSLKQIPRGYACSSDTKEGEKKGFRAANHPAASANRKATIDTLRKIPLQWPPCFLTNLEHSSGAKDWSIPNKIIKTCVNNGALG